MKIITNNGKHFDVFVFNIEKIGTLDLKKKYILPKIGDVDYKPKKSIYYTYYGNYFVYVLEQLRKNYPQNLIKVAFTSYLGGCFFGLVMLAFTFLGTSNQMSFQSSIGGVEKTELYNNMAEFRKSVKKTLYTSVHRNGMFVLRLSLAIAAFNALFVYLPIQNNRFGQFYGFGNLNTLFYFILPVFVLTKLNNVNMMKRSLYAIAIVGSYQLYSIIANEETNNTIRNYLNKSNSLYI